MAGGYTLFAHIAKTTEPIKVVEVTARGPGKIAAVQPAARTDTTDRDSAHDELERVEVPNIAIVPSAAASGANRGDAPRSANRGPALSSVGRDTEVAKIINAFSALIDQADAKTTPGHVKKNDGIEPLNQNEARSVGVQFSSPGKDNGVAKSSSSDAISDEKHHMKIPGRPRVAKRQAANHTPFKQASLENRNTSTCSGSCSGHVPPLSELDLRGRLVRLAVRGGDTPNGGPSMHGTVPLRKATARRIPLQAARRRADPRLVHAYHAPRSRPARFLPLGSDGHCRGSRFSSGRSSKSRQIQLGQNGTR